jgi:hypothetical protein
MIKNTGNEFRNVDMYQLQDEHIKGVIVTNSKNEICILFESGNSLVLYNYYNKPIKIYNKENTDYIVRDFINRIKLDKKELNKTIQYAGLQEDKI